MKISLILTTVFCLTGCLSTLDEIGGVGIINKSVSTFDNEQIVELSSSFALDGDGETASTKIGAKWSSGNPESIFLKLIHTSSVNRSDVYVTYEKIEVNLDGEINEFGAGNTVNNSSGYNTVSKTIYTESAA
jgi:hypothetical protein